MRRREFIALLGGAAVAWPAVVRAQQPVMPVIGFLNSGVSGAIVRYVAAFKQGLSESGFVEGRNVAIEYGWADNKYDRIPALAADLVARQVRVIATSGGIVTAQAVKGATSTIPIVFASGDDPVRGGLVTSLNRPQGNITGVSFVSDVIDVKRLELINQIVPGKSPIAVIANANRPTAEARAQDIRDAARTLGREVIFIDVNGQENAEVAFAAMTERKAGAVLVANDPIFNSWRDNLVLLAAKYSLPAIYYQREFPVLGGFMSYGTDFEEVYRQQGIYVGRILNGATPSDLPILLPSRFELVINLKTAKALGLEIPATLLARADEVIE